MEKTVLSQPEYRSKAARYCSVAEHCENEVRDKLYQWACPRAYMDDIIDYLYDNNYINEQRYCHAFVHDKVNYQGWGRNKIRFALQARHLSANAIRESIDNIDENEYNRQLHRLIDAKKGTEYEKLVRFLLQRGFTIEEISQTLSCSC